MMAAAHQEGGNESRGGTGNYNVPESEYTIRFCLVLALSDMSEPEIATASWDRNVQRR
ncbi:MAG: hypothetical protein ACR2QH_11660 [Geminicoccaceae bacterium]